MLSDRSVLLVTSSDPSNATFGTSFFVGRDAEGLAYVVTCAHVVRDVGGPDTVEVGGNRARLVAMGSPHGVDDIAVLEAVVPEGALPLGLGVRSSTRKQCTVFGFRKLRETVREARRIDGTVGSTLLTTDGRPIAGWSLELNEPLPNGYSGSPVLDRHTGEVIGLASLAYSDSRAVAIAAQEVLVVWPAGARLERQPLMLRTVEFVFVPGGTFAMGTHDARARELAAQRRRPEFAAEAPRARVDLDAFYIARYPITNGQYREFIDDTGLPVPYGPIDPWSAKYSWDRVTRRFPAGLEHQPVVLVSWSQALRYCSWLQARLPTEAEWEKAARGLDERAWPWGDEWRAGACNTVERGRNEIDAVGTYSPAGDSPYGAGDMSGNVWEWCSSLSDPYPYQADDGRESRGAEGRRVLRGGAFEQDRFMARCATRNSVQQDSYGFTIGFRPAVSPTIATAGLELR